VFKPPHLDETVTWTLAFHKQIHISALQILGTRF